MVDYPEVLEDLGGILGEALVKHGLKKDLASEIAWDAVETVRKSWGGRPVYIPKAEQIELSARDHEMYDRFQRSLWPYAALAKTYNLSEMRIRQIVKRARMARRQKLDGPGALFADEDLA